MNFFSCKKCGTDQGVVSRSQFRNIDKRLPRKLVWLRETNQGELYIEILLTRTIRNIKIQYFNYCILYSMQTGVVGNSKLSICWVARDHRYYRLSPRLIYSSTSAL